MSPASARPPAGDLPFDRYSFVAVTTTDLARAREFWVGAMGCRVTEEEPGHHFIADVGGLRLCVDVEDGDVHRSPGPGGSPGGDPVLGLHVTSLERSLASLSARGVRPVEGPTKGRRGSWARLVDPDGRCVILSETD